LSHVILCERDPALVAVLVEYFSDEGISVTQCNSLAEIEDALRQHRHAVIVTDSSWGNYARPELSVVERETLNRLGRETAVIVTTSRSWAQRPAEAGLQPSVRVLPKPYDVDDLLDLIRTAP
jgi:DNA-binding NtrC family response regulator